MKEEPQEWERVGDDQKDGKRWNWGMIIVGLLVVIALAGLLRPMMICSPKATNRAEAISHSKQIGLALLEFDSEFGCFPNNETAAEVLKVTGTRLDLSGTSSNAMFRQLIAFGIQSEDIFYCEHPEGIRKPDRVMTPGKALEAGEVGFSYLCGQKTDVELTDWERPVVATPMKIGTETFWETLGNKAVLLRLDNSVETPTIQKSDGKVPVGGGNTLFDVGADTVWGIDGVVDIRHPEPGR